MSRDRAPSVSRTAAMVISTRVEASMTLRQETSARAAASPERSTSTRVCSVARSPGPTSSARSRPTRRWWSAPLRAPAASLAWVTRPVGSATITPMVVWSIRAAARW